LVTSQGENSAIFGRTFRRGEQEEHTVTVPEGVGWQPIPGHDIAIARITTPMETDRGLFEIHNLASLGIELAKIRGPPPLPRRDGLRSSVATQHFADAVMEGWPTQSDWAFPSWRTREKIEDFEICWLRG
jgi:hypothetical protein